MTPSIPKDIVKILESLDEPEQQRVKGYIETLQKEFEALGGSLDTIQSPSNMETDTEDCKGSGGTEDIGDVSVTHYDKDGGEDYEKQADFKQMAADAKSAGDLNKALEFYNQAVLAAPPSALLYANRSIVLEKLGHFKAAEKDCNLALEQNPDSGKALKTRGKLRYMRLDDWEGALRDLSQAQSIDFDPEVADILKELSKKRIEQERKEAQERIEKEEVLRKKAESIKRAQDEAKREATNNARMPGGNGMPGMSGMPGMPDPSMMAGMMNDPEIQAAMKNPKVVAAFSEIMNAPGGPMGLLSNPGKLQQLMTDPEVGPALNLMMKKMMGGGMPGMGGMFSGGANESDDGIPDLDEMPNLD